MDALGLLERTDKWFLGGGRGALYAPPFPKHLAAPGYWDECYLADLRLERLFTVLFTGPAGRPLRFASHIESWRPDRLVFLHVADVATVRETRCVLPCQAWVSQFELLSGGPLSAFAWSLQDCREDGPGAPWRSVVDASVRDDCLTWAFETRWPAELAPDRTAVESEQLTTGAGMMPGVAVHLALGSSSPRIAYTVNLAQRHDDSPLYETSVLPEKLVRGRLAGDFKLKVGVDGDGLLHLVQQYELSPSKPLVVACGAGLDARQAHAALGEALSSDPVASSEAAWERYFASVPQFESSDPYLNAAYWHRWYGLRLNTVDIPGLTFANGHDTTPYVTEGIGFFRNFITYSAQTHLREVAWMRSPALAEGILDNLVAVQREDGSYPGHNYSARPARDFYHADFATGADLANRLHPGVLNAFHLRSFEAYLAYFERFRRGATEGEGGCYGDGAEPTGTYLVFDMNETGQEYMNRYLFASADADKWGSFRIEGVDATAYVLMLQALVEGRAPSTAGLTRLWNDAAGFFCDRMGDVVSPARPATGFYPLLMPQLPLVRDRLKALMERWLLNSAEFYGNACFPAEAATEPTYCASPEWRDKRTNCPWSGRSWPMVNSHLVDALANVARQELPELRPLAAAALMKAVKLLFHDGDPTRPCCYEHFNPETGVPALYRGYDDYMHSWVVDLIMRHAVGVVPNASLAPSGAEQLPRGWALDPLPLGFDIHCSGIPHPDGPLAVDVVDGKVGWQLER